MTTSIAASRTVQIEAPPLQAVPAAAVALLEQCAAFIRQTSDDAYRGESRALAGGTIGKHVRHLLDHYRALLDPSVAAGTAIDYDHRERNVPMETDRSAALGAIDELRGRVSAMGELDLARRVRVRVMVAGDGTESVLDSTLGRELAFASHHAVHHHAMIKAIGAEHGMTAGAAFGLAPSTINYQAARPANS